MMLELQPYPSTPNTVVGDLRVLPTVYSPQLDNARDIYVWLPPDYERSDRFYPVIYMQDAQNLFDRHVSYSGEWEVDETMTALSAEGLDAIIIALPNMRERRGVEYCPCPFLTYEGTPAEGQGDAYVRFIAETVKPQIDSSLRTRPEAACTGIAGSSMGGLISLYAALAYPHVFGLCGSFSPAYWFGSAALLQSARVKTPYPGRMYLDIGTREGETLNGWFQLSGNEADRTYVQGVRDLHDALEAGGCAALLYIEEEGALHREAAWAKRLPAALRFLLAETRNR